MPNNYFQFKQFRVNQSGSAMKVCTDSCFFGAYINAPNFGSILDIGAGSGLLSLMLAQKSNAEITAVEIEHGSYLQAKENFINSPWAQRIQIINASIQDFAEISTQNFDLIISNPPFFQNSLKKENENENLALHNGSLSFGDLAKSIKKLLNKDGSCWILLPHHESKIFCEAMHGHQLFLDNSAKLFTKDGGNLLRVINCFTSVEKEKLVSKDFSIKNSSNEYSEEFKNVLKDFYLAF